MMSNRLQPSCSIVDARWKPPPPSFVKINFDANYKSASKLASLGIIIRDEDGFILGASCSLSHPISSIFDVEARAAVQGITFAYELGFRKIILKGDSRSVVTKFNSSKENLSEISAHIWDAKVMLRNFNASRIIFTPREGNRTTHAMAKERFYISKDRIWVEDAPPYVTHQADEDHRNLNPH
ncbi:hypothetical protein like AT3G25270 [Hibiscus trionum]|uniref:RNase H type-1 domain-containing protein n=1 Tax=Hibiscus trionum TaxID=183268 RepID=A0A9W7I024_HIBTR|nr:hypothetical protein like AT3G25270 [Hibiscus trionum]